MFILLIATVILSNFFAWMLFSIQGKKEALIITQTGHEGIWKLTGKHHDHAFWQGERLAIAVLCGCFFSFGYLFFTGTLSAGEIIIISLGIWTSYFFMHDGFYYRAYERLKPGHYEEGFKDESETTTADISLKYPWRKAVFIAGVVIQIAALIVL